MNAVKVVLLAGGFGTRISEESHLKPKPMIEIGSQPILPLKPDRFCMAVRPLSAVCTAAKTLLRFSVARRLIG